MRITIFSASYPVAQIFSKPVVFSPVLPLDSRD
jgi:hypothetical protein